MPKVTIEEIQNDPLKYLRQAESGETFIIVQADEPIAELRPIASKNKFDRATREERKDKKGKEIE